MLTTEERINEEIEKLIGLCKDFNSEDHVASKIEIISSLLNTFLEDETVLPKTARSITYDMTVLITFLAHLHESVTRIGRLEQSLTNQSEN